MTQSTLNLELSTALVIVHMVRICRHAGCKCERRVEVYTKVLERC